MRLYDDGGGGSGNGGDVGAGYGGYGVGDNVSLASVIWEEKAHDILEHWNNGTPEQHKYLDANFHSAGVKLKFTAKGLG